VNVSEKEKLSKSLKNKHIQYHHKTKSVEEKKSWPYFWKRTTE